MISHIKETLANISTAQIEMQNCSFWFLARLTFLRQGKNFKTLDLLLLKVKEMRFPVNQFYVTEFFLVPLKKISKPEVF